MLRDEEIRQGEVSIIVFLEYNEPAWKPDQSPPFYSDRVPSVLKLLGPIMTVYLHWDRFDRMNGRATSSGSIRGLFLNNQDGSVDVWRSAESAVGTV